MNEKRLTFGEFVDEVRRSIKDYLPEKFADAEVHVDQFQKLNTAYLGMQVKREDQMVVPNINLNGMYAQYQEQGHTMAAMLTMIAQQVQMAPEIRTDWLKDYSQVKDHLFIRVSDAKENEGVLKNAPHKEVDGLAVSYHIAIEGMQASTPVTYQMMEMYGVTAEQLHADALESTQKLYPVKYASMAEVMQQMMGIEPDMAADMMPPMEGPQPSSVHEVLIRPDDGSQDLDSLQFMVREINRTEVAPEDRLSDFVYHYDAQDHVLERAETFAERMAQKEQEAEKAVPQEPEKTAEPREAKMEDAREPEPEKKEHAAGKERKSVLGRLNEKKEQVKGQPKKSGPNRAQEASI